MSVHGIVRGRLSAWTTTWFIFTVSWLCLGCPSQVKGFKIEGPLVLSPSFTYFTLNDTANGDQSVQVGCQPQDHPTDSPLLGLQQVQVIRIDSSCADQEANSKFFELSQDDLGTLLAGKVALVQFSDCSSNWEEFHKNYFQLAFLLAEARVKGMIFAEKSVGKMPGVLYAESVSIQYLLPPTCVISAKDYANILSITGVDDSRPADEINAFAIDTSSVRFPIPVFPSSADISDSAQTLVQAAQAQAASVFQATLTDPASDFEVSYFGNYRSFGPSDHPSVSSKVVFASLHADCQALDYGACAACWSKEPSEIFVNSNEMAGKIVWIRRSEVGTHCFYSFQEYTVLLQQLEASAVVFGMNSSSADYPIASSYYTFFDVGIPTFTMSTVLEADLEKEGTEVRDYELQLPAFERFELSSTLKLHRQVKGSLGFWAADQEDFSVDIHSCPLVNILVNKNTTIKAVKGPTTLTEDASGNLMDGQILVKVQPTLECSRNRSTLDCGACVNLNASNQIVLDTSQYGTAKLSALVETVEFPCHSFIELMEAVSAVGKEKSLQWIIVPLITSEDAKSINDRYVISQNVDQPILIMEEHCYLRFSNVFLQEKQVYIGVPQVTSSAKGAIKVKGHGIRTKKDIKEEEKILMEVIGGPEALTLQGPNLAGKAEISTAFGALVGEVELLLAPDACNNPFTCTECAPTFSEGQFQDKIVLIPGDASNMGGVVSNGHCLKPIYSFVKLCQDLGAKAVVYGIRNDKLLIYGQNGWHEDINIPIVFITRDLAEIWGKASVEKSPPLILFMSGETQDEYKGQLNHLLPDIIGSRLYREYLNPSENTVEPTEEQTTESEDVKTNGNPVKVEDGSKEGRWVYGLWGGLSAGIFAALCAGALLVKRHYQRKRRSTREQGAHQGQTESDGEHDSDRDSDERNSITIEIPSPAA